MIRCLLAVLCLLAASAAARVPCQYGWLDADIVESPMPAIDCAQGSGFYWFAVFATPLVYAMGCQFGKDGRAVVVAQRGGPAWVLGHELAHAYGMQHSFLLPLSDSCAEPARP